MLSIESINPTKNTLTSANGKLKKKLFSLSFNINDEYLNITKVAWNIEMLCPT